LAIAKEIVVQHGGRIYAESNNEQTAFIVELPTTPQPLP
jgi:two-component system sensor histidine kinase VanS